MPAIHGLVKRPEVHSVQKERLVLDVVQFMTQMNVGAVSVLEGENLVGIFSERDLMTRVVSKGLSPADTPVEQVMTPDPVTGMPDEDRRSAIQKMQTAGCRHLPIVAGETVIDMLSMRDLLFDELEERNQEIAELRGYIRGSY